MTIDAAYAHLIPVPGSINFVRSGAKFSSPTSATSRAVTAREAPSDVSLRKPLWKVLRSNRKLNKGIPSYGQV